MTVKDLRERLNEFQDDDLVVLSRDAEGNGFSQLARVDSAYCDDSRAWDIDVSLPDDGKPCVVLGPV